MAKWISALLSTLIVLSALVGSGHAQATTVHFSSMEIDLWPEYDRPSVLVIYRITLSADTPLPADLVVRLPASVSSPNAVAVRQADGTLMNADNTTQLEGAWLEVSFSTTLPEVQVEYYDSNLVKQQNQRSFEFLWPGDYAVDALSVQVQQPVGASNTVITPGPVTAQTGKDGLTYFTKIVGPVAQNQTFSIKIEYQKADDSLSAESLQVQPGSPLAAEQSSAASWTNYLPWGLGIIGLILIFGGGYWYWQSGRQTASARPRKRSRASKTASIKQDDQGEVYCHACGKRAAAGDQFCRACGTRLRVSD